MTLALPWPQLTAAFVLAIFGAAHCVTMCGGFVGSLQWQRPADVSATRLALGYHTGRIVSYSTAGALAGALGAGVFAVALRPLQVLLLVAASMLLLVIAVSMFGAGSWLRRLPLPLAKPLWRFIAPTAQRFYPPRTPQRALVAGLLWGWIPCGMVYTALPLALVTGSAWRGALVMWVFGLSTLPALVLLDALSARLKPNNANKSSNAQLAPTVTPPVTQSTWSLEWLQWRSRLRPLAGALLIFFSVANAAQAARVAGLTHPALLALSAWCGATH